MLHKKFLLQIKKAFHTFLLSADKTLGYRSFILSIGSFLCEFCRAFHGTSFQNQEQHFIIFSSRDICQTRNVAKLLVHPVIEKILTKLDRI
jgi:hypothetical protein